MPTTILSDDQQRFVQLLRRYLTKSGRKQVELARFSSSSESLLSKLLKGKTPPDLGGFCKFQAPFLVAHGGIAQARQVSEMAALLGRDLDKPDLLAIAQKVEHVKDPELDTAYFRDRAEAFRRTIPEALNWAETGPAAAAKRAEPLEILAEPPVVDAGGASDDHSAETTLDELEEQPSAAAAVDLTAALAEWQAVLREIIQPAPTETLEPDEVIAAVLQWESRQTDPQVAAAVWDWLGSPETFEKLRQRERLEFVLHGYDGQKTWSRLEWEWLNFVLAETARRAGQSQLSPSQLLVFVADLGQVAFEAVKADTKHGAHLAVNLSNLSGRLPIVQATDWRWLQNVAHAGPIRLSVSADQMCRFESREEAEFLAAQYLLNSGSDQGLVRIARNCGQPFGVLWQAVRSLRFAGRDEAAGKLIQELLHVSEELPLCEADAAHLLAACDAPKSISLKPIWKNVESTLARLWWANHAPEYRAYIARAMRDPDWTYFREVVQGTLGPEWLAGRPSDSIMRSLALLGGADAVDTFWTLTQKPVPTSAAGKSQEEPWNPLEAVLAVAPDLAPGEQITLLERLALSAAEPDGRGRAVQALAEVGSIPAIHALDRIAAAAGDPTLARFAQSERAALDSPAYAALVARELDVAVADGEPASLLACAHAARGLLWRSSSPPSPVVSRSLARVWANLDLDQGVRIEAALGLIAAHACPALDICLGTLPLADQAGDQIAGLLPQLLPALSSPAATPRLWQLLDQAISPARRAILIHCLGQAGGMALDERFEQLLAAPSEAIAVAAVAALAQSRGPAAASRLAQVAAGDRRPVVQTAASEGLAEIGSEQALPYLREKLKDPQEHADVLMQLARLHHPEAETLLVEAARAETVTLIRDHVCLPALARSGGATAVQALRDLLGPEPDEKTLNQVRAKLSPDTVARAPGVWGRLADDVSPAWRMTAVAVLVQDSSQTLIEKVVRVAVEGTEWTVREYARDCLHEYVFKIVSPAVAEYVLQQLEQQVAQFGQPAAFLLEVMCQCLSGLTTDERGLPPEIARRARAILWQVLSRASPTDECFVPVLAALAFPEFREAAGELEHLLSTVMDAATARQILETLIAMQAPSLPEVLIRLAKSARWPALQERASDYLAEVVEYNGLARAPNDLKHVAYRVAIQKGVRFRRDGLRHTVILANGATYRAP